MIGISVMGSSHVVGSISDWSMGYSNWSNRSCVCYCVVSWSNDKSSFVDGSVGRILGFDSRLVGLDVSSESSGVSNVVNDSDSAISVSEAVGTSYVAMSISRFSSESAAS